MTRVLIMLDKSLVEKHPASASLAQRWVEAVAATLAVNLQTLPPAPKGKAWTFDVTQSGEETVARVFLQAVKG